VEAEPDFGMRRTFFAGGTVKGLGALPAGRVGGVWPPLAPGGGFGPRSGPLSWGRETGFSALGTAKAAG
jgi:hypothetical protein